MKNPPLIVALTLLCAGCSGLENDSETRVPEKSGAEQVDADQQYKRSAFPHEYINDCELACVVGDFPRHINLKTSPAPTPLPATAFRFTVKSYNDAIAAIPGGTGPQAVVVHNGLGATNRMELAFEFVRLKPMGGDEYSYDPPNHHYVINGSTLTRQNGPVENWKTTFWQRYKNGIVFRDTPTSSWRDHDPAKDVEYIVYSHDAKLRMLIAHNAMTDSDLLEIKPVAEPLNGVTDFRQGLVWVPTNVSIASRPGPNGDFHLQAADIGSPCPKACPPNIVLRTTGVAVRCC